MPGGVAGDAEVTSAPLCRLEPAGVTLVRGDTSLSFCCAAGFPAMAPTRAASVPGSEWSGRAERPGRADRSLSFCCAAEFPAMAPTRPVLSPIPDTTVAVGLHRAAAETRGRGGLLRLLARVAFGVWLPAGRAIAHERDLARAEKSPAPPTRKL